jgi:hypothetical protein
MRSHLAAAGILAVLLAPWPSAAQSRDSAANRFHSSVSASSGERLEIRLDSGGGLRVSTWDRDEVAVESEGSLRACPDAELSLERIVGGVRLASLYPEDLGSSHTCSLSLLIRVPRKFDVSISSSGGGFEATGLHGRIDGQTGGGSIRLSDVHGSVRLATGGGEIVVTDSDLDGRLSTGGGQVRFEHVTGKVVGTSGSMRREVRGQSRSQ